MSGLTLIYPSGFTVTGGTTTSRALITRALLSVGAIAEGETPSASLAMQCHAVLAGIVDAWAIDRLFLYQSTRTVQTFVAGQADYTLGTGGDFDQDRPAFVDAITVLDTTSAPAVECPPLRAFTDDEWTRVPDKAMSGDPAIGYTLNRSMPLMTITFYPVPASTMYRPVIYAPGGILTDIPPLDTAIVMPPGYYKALHYALAAELSMIPGLSPAPRGDLGKMASLSIARIKSQNVQIGTLGVDDALLGGGPGYNWRTGR